MASVKQNGISVLQNNRMVRLIPDTDVRGVDPRNGKEQPWGGVVLERHRVGAMEIPEHVHGDFCLHLQLSGDSDFEWWSEGKNRVEKTAPGSLILLAPGTRDRLRWEGASERVIVSVSPELLGTVARDLGGVGGVDFRNQWALQDGAVENLLREMGRETADGWPLGGLYADLLGVGLAGLLLRRHADSRLMASEAKGMLPMPKLKRAMEFMTENLQEDLRLEEIAAQVDLSAFHFAREFRKTAGRTVYQYVLDQRIAAAKVLLASGGLPIADVGMQSGFRSAVNFVRAFRERVGVTPGAWRDGVRG